MPTTAKFLLLLTTSPSPSLLRLLPPLFSLSHPRFRSTPLPLKLKPFSSSSFSNHHFHSQINANPFPPPPSPQLIWPELSHFLTNISASAYFAKSPQFHFRVDEFGLPDEFINAANASLSFAQDFGYLIGRLSKRDIEVVVENGNAGLFEHGNEVLTRMRGFLTSQSGAVLSATDSGPMVDLMKILLSCASNFIYSENSNLHEREFLESSVRNLFSQLAHLSCNTSEPNVYGSMQNQFSDSNRQMSGSFQNNFPDRNGQVSRPHLQNVEMKRGDWICSRCSFMNFARNIKCLECEEVRPKRQLTGGEWECPQCDFFNYGRNAVCLRCDCKRPGEVSHGFRDSGSGTGYGRDNYASNADIEKRLAENEEKAQRWFSKISQMDSTSDMSSAIEDEDFPEIMPLRKGVNRFVVSTRKTPLERRLADVQYKRNSSYAGDSGISNAQGSATNNQTPRQALDDIIGRRYSAPDSKIVSTEQNSRTDAHYSVQQQHGAHSSNSSNYVPFVPLPADMFARKTENEKTDERSKVEGHKYRPLSSGAGEQASSSLESNDYDKSGQSWHPSNQQEQKQTEQSDIRLERVAEQHNVTDPISATPDEFSETMPMRKGENRFVVSKKKDRSLSSPMYKRQVALEQANNPNYVAFVPFPPDYFAKKDTQQLDGASVSDKATGETSNSFTQANLSGNSDDIGARTSGAEVPIIAIQQYNTGSWNSNSQEHVNQRTSAAGGLPTSRTSTQQVVDPQFNMTDNRSSGFSWNEDNKRQKNTMPNSQQSYFQEGGNNSYNIGSSYPRKENFNRMENSARSMPQPPENGNSSNSWSGKSLEGSLVKEPDPLDMSEEAKAERWFRRVAQIKDISELSQIPDEDFPSIMPMRKGVNRFVVSKRKTPLERRLTSTQYRKNLPTVRSDPVKENDSS